MAPPTSPTQNTLVDEQPSTQAPTPESFVAELAGMALRHRAVRHPYLRALREGTLPDLRWALADFARQYHGYSAHFPRYLTAVIAHLEDPLHRELMLENLSEESGSYEPEELAELAAQGIEPEWIVGVPHPQLFARFGAELGVDPTDAPESDAVVCWRELFLAQLSGGSAAEAVGALGLGTENVVQSMYGSFVAALTRLPELDPRATVFFTLHATVDDHHQESLARIASDLAETRAGRDDLRRGMLKALQLRSSFWDWMLERALDPSSAHLVL
jgi:pyrroloquinoline quinone (PQQ) biosynthesis protein C